MPRPTKSKQTAIEVKAGLESDFNFSAWSGVLWGFVCAGINQAAGALKDELGAKRWVKDISKKGAVSEGDYFLPFKVAGNDWTNVVDVAIHGKKTISEELLAAVSKKLKTRTIFAVYENTAGVFLYALYDQGKIVEVLHWDGAAKSKVVKNPEAAREGFCFYSSLRPIRPGELTAENVTKFFDSFLKSQGAFLVLESGSSQNGVVTFSPERVGASEIERADYIGILSERELAPARIHKKANAELGGVVDKCVNAFFWAFKAREEYKDWKYMRPTRAACAEHEADYRKLLAQVKLIIKNGVVPSEKLLNFAARNGNMELLQVLSKAAGHTTVPDSFLTLAKQSEKRKVKISGGFWQSLRAGT